jgi:hypothetical protein
MTGDGTKIVFTTSTTTQHPGSARDQNLRVQERFVMATVSAALHTDRVKHASQQVIKQAEQRVRQAEAKLAKYAPTFTSVVEAIEVLVRTGKPVLVLGRRHVPGFANEWPLWTNPAGTTLIVAGNGPRATQNNPQTELGVIQPGNPFTPLPKGVQAFLGQTPTW